MKKSNSLYIHTLPILVIHEYNVEKKTEFGAKLKERVLNISFSPIARTHHSDLFYKLKIKNFLLHIFSSY